MAAKFQLTDQQRQRLRTAFIDHRADLWPYGDPRVTPQWIRENVDRIFETLTYTPPHQLPERLYWVVPLLADLEHEQRPKS